MSTPFPSAGYPLAVGLLLTSSLFFGNVGLNTAGPLRIIREKVAPTGLSTKDKARVFSLHFDAAAIPVVLSSLTSSALFAYTAYSTSHIHPGQSTIQLSATFAAIATVLPLPITIAIILPVVNRIKEADQRGHSSTGLSTTEEKATLEDIALWDNLHQIRVVLFGLGWVLGVRAMYNLLVV